MHVSKPRSVAALLNESSRAGSRPVRRETPQILALPGIAVGPHQFIWMSTHQRGSSLAMRTTLNIDDEILEAARSITGERNLSVGAALSELARRGLRPAVQVGRRRSGFPVFEISHAGTVLTLERVRKHEDDP